MGTATDMPIVTTPRSDMSFCPGCSHGAVLEHLGRAIERIGLPPHRVCLVSDIGCIGMADRYVSCHTFHGLHGRSITYAEGIKRMSPDTLVIVLIGDGGCGIGTGHLVHAARRHANIKVVVCNNFNYGMTGGQHSCTTPAGTMTSTTPCGDAEHVFDICQTVAINGASHVSRYSALDPHCTDQIEAMLRHSGFGLIDLWELCVAYFVPANQLRPPDLTVLSRRLNLPFGIIRDADDFPSPPPSTPNETRTVAHRPAFRKIDWPRRAEVRIAGSAGQRIRSAGGVFGKIAVACGLHAAQLDDFPISVRKGFSVSSLIISPEPILHANVDEPDLVVLLSEDGLARLGSLNDLPPNCLLLADDQLDLPTTSARLHRINFKAIERQVGKPSAALTVLTMGIVMSGWISTVDLTEAADLFVTGHYRDASLKAIRTATASETVGNDRPTGDSEQEIQPS